MQSIGIFCAASNAIDASYFRAAEEVGRWIGASGHRLVYGGAALGLMEAVATATRQAGGPVLGVVPTKLVERNIVSSQPTDIIHCHDLSDRKDIMLRESDLIVALPGGIGTVDEVFHVMGGATIGYHRKRVVLYDVDGYWAPLLALLADMQQRGFIRRPLSDFVVSVSSVAELEALCHDEK